MSVFKDRVGRQWTIDLTVGAVKRVKAALGLNLYELVDDDFKRFAALLSDPLTLVDVVWVLIADQAVKLGVTDEQFGESLAAESVQELADAFAAAYVDFFQDRSQAAVLQKVFAKAKQTAAAVMSENEAAIDRLDVASLVESLKKKSGSPPAS